MLVACEALAVSAGLLLLPSGLIDVAFGTNLFIILAQAMFIAVILTAILTCMAIQQGWFADYLFRNRIATSLEAAERREPTFRGE